MRQQLLFEKARVALAESDFGYALEACAEILRSAPRFVPARKLQREASLRRFATGNWLVAKARAGMSASPFIFGVNEDDPHHSFASAEKILAVDPTSAVGLKLLGQSAELLHWPETAVFAYEALREVRPEDRETLLVLAAALLADGRAGEGLAVAEQVLKDAPADAVALQLHREASVTQTMSTGTWTNESSYRQ